MSKVHAITGVDIFDGEMLHRNAALAFTDKSVISILPQDDISAESDVTQLSGGVLVPGFVDLQANGGGGILFNEKPDVEGIRTLCAAHAKFGTTAVLVTLITDRAEITQKAIDAGIEAHYKHVPGFLGLHLEGPHLSVAKKGAHDSTLIRPMTQTDVDQLLWAKSELPNLMITIAPESVTEKQISRLTKAGIIVSLGHTNASYKQTALAVQAGATCVTHLYNAMSPLTHRQPGVVGAALEIDKLFCGLIADGYHVDRPAIAIALAAKKDPGKIFLITDAMSPLGTNMLSFTLNGRTIHRSRGRLILEEGTLAGADLDMMSAVNNIQKMGKVNFQEAIRMATIYPSQCLGIDKYYGLLKPDFCANFVHINSQQNVESVWLEGKQIYHCSQINKA